MVIHEESRPLSEIRSFVPTFCDFEIDAQVSPGWIVYVCPERQTVLGGGVVVLDIERQLDAKGRIVAHLHINIGRSWCRQIVRYPTGLLKNGKIVNGVGIVSNRRLES